MYSVFYKTCLNKYFMFRNVDENETEEYQNGKKLPKFGYVSTFFKPPSEEEQNNSNGNVDSIDLF